MSSARGVVVETRMYDSRPQAKVKFTVPFTLLLSNWMEIQNPYKKSLPDFGAIVIIDRSNTQAETGNGTITNELYVITGPGGKTNRGISQQSVIWDAMQRYRPKVKKVKGVKRTTINDAEVKKVVEELEHRMSDFAGYIGSHTHPIFNQILSKQAKNIPTALASTASILTSAMKGNIPGIPFSLGNLQSLLTDSMLKEITDALPPNLQTVLNTALNNMVTIEGEVDGKRVNLPVFLVNAVAELKTAKTVGDITSILEKFRDDDSFSGMDELEDYIEEVAGVFGNTNISINSTGNVTASLTDAAQSAFTASFSALESIKGVSGELWDDPELQKKFGHMTEKAQKALRELLEELKGNL